MYVPFAAGAPVAARASRRNRGTVLANRRAAPPPAPARRLHSSWSLRRSTDVRFWIGDDGEPRRDPRVLLDISGWLSQQADPVLTHYSSQIQLQLWQRS